MIPARDKKDALLILRIPKEVKERLAKVAKRTKNSMSIVALFLIEEGLRHLKK